MLSKYKFLFNSYDILLVFRIIIFQRLKYFCLNQSLFIQSLFVPQYFQGSVFLCFMIKAFKNLAKGTLTKTICYFESVSDVITLLCYVFIFIVVKTIVFYAIWCSIFILFTIINWKEVNCIIFKNFCFLVI